jgi:hypothetical protein
MQKTWSVMLLGALGLALTACASAAVRQVTDGGGDAGPGDGGQQAVCGNGLIELGEQCDDGNAAGGDGCSAQCQFEGCDPTTCASGCCDLQGNCVGGTEDTACGSGGTGCQDCTVANEICSEQACEALPSCVEGDTLPCGNCGTRICDASGQWGPCSGEGACAAGTTDTGGGSCGNCGELQRTCDNNCDWGTWECVNEGVCSPGSLDTGGSCGNGGTEQRTCEPTCVWGAWSCEGEGTCTPGTTETGSSCGNCGTEERTCDSAGDWGAWSCVGEGTCSPGTTQTGGSCGNCGTEQRTCTNSCTWGSYACTGEGVCSPGTTQTGGACCYNGNYEQTCTNSCTWGGSVCVGNTSCTVTGHLTCGEHGDPCSEPGRDWRCVYSANWGTTVSQYCEDGIWKNYNLTPSNCEACCLNWSTACDQ